MRQVRFWRVQVAALGSFSFAVLSKKQAAGVSDWFVIPVRAGCEAEALSLLLQSADGSGVKELFVPQAEMRAGGAARDGSFGREVVPLVPGCVVAVAPGAGEVRAVLRRARGMAGIAPGGFMPLGDDEARLLDELTGSGEAELPGEYAQPEGRVAAFSEGRQRDGRLVVENGALRGHEPLVRAVSHRKKRAYLSLTLAGRQVDAQVGLRVTRGK